MILRSLTLQDFGLYAGRQHMDLTPHTGRPVVLVGGTNGAGKTTILEALLLCLHGRRGLWPQVSVAEYHRRLVARIHQPVGTEPPVSAAVELVLDHTDGGRTRQYVVRRAWRRTPAGSVKEELHLARDGESIDDVTGTMRQEFLDSLVPPALAGLFFFDGEKIQDLADNDTSGALRDAVRRLLGLDLLERLQSDLTRYVIRDADDARSAELQSAAKQALAAYDAAVVGCDRAHHAVRMLLNDRSDVEARLARAEERFSAEGGPLAAERRRLQERHVRATNKIEAGTAQLHEMVSGLLPMAICPELGERLEAQLGTDERARGDALIRERLNGSAGVLTKALRPAARGSDVLGILVDVLLSDAPVRPTRHDVSPGTRARMLADLAQIRGGVPERAQKAAAEIRRARKAAEPLRAALEGAPDEVAVAPMLRELQDLGRKRGRLDERIAAAEEEARHREHLRRVAERDLRAARDRLASATGVSDRAARAAKTVAVIEAFEEKVGARRMRDVELQTARFFNRLSRKGDMFADVRIDRDTFEVKLTRWDQTTLRKAQLSAGERQLFAIAVLWALASVSGRPLPVVVDTPLARLDRAHRRALLQEYFPEVAAQVVILSTDTELDEEAALALAPVVTRCYRLDHDPALCATTIADGYFADAAQGTVG